MTPSEFIGLVDLLPSFCGAQLLDPSGVGRTLLSNQVTGFNLILEGFVNSFRNKGVRGPDGKFHYDPKHNYFYTSAVYDHSRDNGNGIPETEVSDIDCYHPSGEGQKVISEETWLADDGPKFFDK